jgi:hypothetical protein
MTSYQYLLFLEAHHAHWKQIHKKEARGPSIIDQIITARDGACHAEATVVGDARTHSSLRIVCTMEVKLTIT